MINAQFPPAQWADLFGSPADWISPLPVNKLISEPTDQSRIGRLGSSGIAYETQVIDWQRVALVIPNPWLILNRV